jgi:hypothetical protein
MFARIAATRAFYGMISLNQAFERNTFESLGAITYSEAKETILTTTGVVEIISLKPWGGNGRLRGSNLCKSLSETHRAFESANFGSGGRETQSVA